jgi:hypothetical protein
MGTSIRYTEEMIGGEMYAVLRGNDMTICCGVSEVLRGRCTRPGVSKLEELD